MILYDSHLDSLCSTWLRTCMAGHPGGRRQLWPCMAQHTGTLQHMTKGYGPGEGCQRPGPLQRSSASLSLEALRCSRGFRLLQARLRYLR